MIDSSKYCTMYIVRHGETEWNVKQIMMGHKDSPLTANGIVQAHKLKENFKDIKFDAVFSSDSSRAKTTAAIIILEKNLAIKTTELLREKAYGAFEGGLVKDYTAALKEALGKKENLSDEERFNNKTGTGDESEAETTTRFVTHLREIAAAYVGKKVLVVSHGGCIRMFLMHLGFATRQELVGAVKNTAYVKVLTDGIDFFIEETVGINKNKI
ncbi:MAG: histidine phosphatase family protein [Candidatus Falkowbacteria bacterium]|nr:histidine phosphatase family protein [Candidatus Falkowbacteria bacterium]